MTPIEIRIAIAEACGWKKENPSSGTIWGAVPGGYPDSKIWWYPHQLPHYEEDLNDMYSAEEIMTDSQWDNYWFNLDPGPNGHQCKTLLHATALQRAEAFLKTKNLWRDA